MSSIGRRGHGRRNAAIPTLSNEKPAAPASEPRPYVLFRYRLAPSHPYGHKTIADEFKWQTFGSHMVYLSLGDIPKFGGNGQFVRLTELPGPNPNLEELAKELHIVILSFDRLTEAEMNKMVKEASAESDRQRAIADRKCLCGTTFFLCSIALGIATLFFG